MKFKNPFQSATEKVISTSEENKLYEKVTVAIENNDIDKGVWTKAFTQADGDTTKQKVIYIELMVEHYKDKIRAREELETILVTAVNKDKATQEEALQRRKLLKKSRTDSISEEASSFPAFLFFAFSAFIIVFFIVLFTNPSIIDNLIDSSQPAKSVSSQKIEEIKSDYHYCVSHGSPEAFCSKTYEGKPKE